MDLSPLRFINLPLIKEPLNWAIVAIIATIWLLAFHCIMRGFTAMQGKSAVPSIGANPGQIAAPQAPAFASGQTSDLGTSDLGTFLGGGGVGLSPWGGDDQARWAEDGWAAN